MRGSARRLWPAGGTGCGRWCGWVCRRRSALVASGRYWVWSVVWEDVQAALGGQTAYVLDVVGNHARHAPNANIVANVRTRHGRGTGELTEHAVARLLRWLAEPVANERV